MLLTKQKICNTIKITIQILDKILDTNGRQGVKTKNTKSVFFVVYTEKLVNSITFLYQ